MPASPPSQAELGASNCLVVFLFISGFAIAHSLRNGSRGFYERRFYRIWPVYALAVALALVPYVRGAGVVSWPDGEMSEVPGRFQLINNLLCLQPLLTLSLGTLGPSWSLGVEVAYYLVAPLLGRIPRRGLVGAIALSVLLSYHYTRHGLWMPEKTGAVPYVGYFWAWALGWDMRARRNQPAFRFLCLGVVLAAGWTGGVFPLGLGCLLFQDQLPVPARWAPLALWLGEISYPLYITHEPVKAIVSQQWPHLPVTAYYLICVGASALIYHAFDAPLRRWHRRRLAATNGVAQLGLTAGMPGQVEPGAQIQVAPGPEMPLEPRDVETTGTPSLK